RRRGVDARANAALLRRLLQRRHLLARLLDRPRSCDQLVDRRHVSLHPFIRAATEHRLRKFLGNFLPFPAAPRETIRAKRNRASHSSLSGKRFDATEDRGLGRSAIAVQPDTEVMHPKSISRELARENQDRLGIA